jgi:phosphoribosylglycinamide formyltransferase-1
MYMPILRLGFLSSHGGSNMQAILDACKIGLPDGSKLNAVPSVVISNNSASMSLSRARSEGIPAYHVSSANYAYEDEIDQAILDILKKHYVNLVVLAGYMKKLGPLVLKNFKNHILNIHPALLPEHGGKGMYGIRVHEAVIAAGEKESGPTIHLVDELYDHGRILAQLKVPVLPDDTPETLAARVLIAEHSLYPMTIKKIADGEIIL